MATPSLSPTIAESELLGMPVSTAGAVLALTLLFSFFLIQLLSNVTGCRGLSAPEVKNAAVAFPKPPKRFSTTGNYQSTRDLTGSGPIQPEDFKQSISNDTM